MLTKGGGNSEMVLSARAAPVICTYVPWMIFYSVSVICVCINSALLDVLLCGTHITNQYNASLPHFIESLGA